MPAPRNRFKAALAAGKPLFGCWLGTAEAYLAEVTGRAGFDWVLVDGEHAPNDLRSITAQLQVLEGLGPDVLVRLPWGEDWRIKQALDAGAQSLMIPMVESAAEARRLVRATRYPPEGIRGMGAMLARASRFGAIGDYAATANDQICLIVQLESGAALDAIEEICAVDGIDGCFIGPADLGADLGLAPGSEALRARIHDALGRIRACGKAAGVMSTDDAATPGHIAAGATILAVGIDICLMAEALRAKAARWSGGEEGEA